MAKEIKVNLRHRPIDGGRQEELFIDYMRGGRRTRQSLGIFVLSKCRTRIEKKMNEEKWMIAEAKRKHIEDMLNGRAEESETSLMLFFEWYRTCMDAHKGKTRESWQSALVHLQIYEPDERILIGDITRDWVEGYRAYLESKAVTKTEKREDKRYGSNGHYCKNKTRNNEHRPLSQNTTANYFAKLVACLNKAKADGIVKTNPADGIKRISVTDGNRVYLTAKELRKLMSTDCEDNAIKRAFIFACMTGLRFSDIRRLTWGDIQDADGYVRLVFTQQKTGQREYPPLNKAALKQLGKRGEPEQLVFLISGNKRTNDVLSRWCKAAKITKHVTFHCSRHTFATLLLESNTDIYTASKLLGHRKVSTTQIYAKVVDRKKREAVDRLNDLI